MQEDREILGGQLVQRGQDQPLPVSRSPEPRSAPCIYAFQKQPWNSIGSQCRDTSAVPFTRTPHITTANTATCLVKPFWFPWAPIIFLQLMGPFLKPLFTLHTFMYTWFSHSVIKYLTEATEGGMTYFITQIEGGESSIAEESTPLTARGRKRKTMQFSLLPPF